MQPARLAYFAFDLLWLDGEDLRGLPLVDRKDRLEQLLESAGARLIYSEHVPAEQGQALYDRAIAAGCEGIVSKRADSRYRPGDTRSGVKVKPAEVRKRQAKAIREGFERAARRRGVKVGASGKQQ